MKRLTKWEEANEQWIENHDDDTREWKNGNRAVMDKLAAYEDTGYTPERCAEIAEAEREGRVIGTCRGCLYHGTNDIYKCGICVRNPLNHYFDHYCETPERALEGRRGEG